MTRTRVRRGLSALIAAGVALGSGPLVLLAAESPAPPGDSQKAGTNLFELRGTPFPEDAPVQVVPLSRTDAVSVQLVRVKHEVRPHIHRLHTETVAILWGEGVFRIGEEEHEAVPGDVFVIPPGTVHAFRVRGEEPVGAVTTFSPGFDGKDRVFVDGP